MNNADFTGVAVAVLSPESDPRMEVAADVTVNGVDECVDLLTRLADFLANDQ
jgi:hypothetical protein